MPIFRRKPAPKTGSNDGLSASARVWNRALTPPGDDTWRTGDRALAALLRIHSLAMNGGLLHAVQISDDSEIRDAIDGFRYFGLNEEASAVAWTREACVRLTPEANQDLGEEIEVEADRRYGDPEQAIFDAFELGFRKHSNDFAPL